MKINFKKNTDLSDDRIVTLSCKVDLIDVFINGIVALITGSVIMLAEVFQAISDLIVDGLTYIGMKRSKREPTKKHPLGYGRELYIWSLFSTLIMFLVLTGMSFYFGIQRFISPEPIDHVFLIYLILTISLFTNTYSFSFGAKRLLDGRPFWKIKKVFTESTFLETKITFVADLMGILAAFFGLVAISLFSLTGNLWFDGLGAIGISILMGIFSIFLFKNIKDFIIGVSAPESTKQEIEKAALEIEGVRDILDLKVMVIGSNRLLVNLEIHVKENLITQDIEKLIDKVKSNIKIKIPSVFHVQIELETP